MALCSTRKLFLMSPRTGRGQLIPSRPDSFAVRNARWILNLTLHLDPGMCNFQHHIFHAFQEWVLGLLYVNAFTFRITKTFFIDPMHCSV